MDVDFSAFVGDILRCTWFSFGSGSICGLFRLRVVWCMSGDVL